MKAVKANEPLPKSPSRAIIAAAVGAVIVILAVASILLTRKSTDKVVLTGGEASEAVQETSAVTVTGVALALQPEEPGAPDPALGKAAPKVVGATFSGQTETIAPGSKPMVLAFVAHWCPHCQREVPKLADWARGGERNGVEIRAIATGTASNLPNYPPSAWLAREKFDVPTMADDDAGAAAKAYGLTSFPYFVAIDASGKVTARVSGELSETQFDELVSKAKA
jgi:cytochrome c biogenesis protein CcmG, thiol:disulfide interchange protein DsbE